MDNGVMKTRTARTKKKIKYTRSIGREVRGFRVGVRADIFLPVFAMECAGLGQPIIFIGV